MSAKAEAAKWAVIVGGGLVAAYFIFNKAEKTVQAVAVGINPADRNNWVYSSVNVLGDIIDDGTKDNSFSLGSWIADIFPSAAEREFSKMMAGDK
jgi:hypothetical protein